MTGNRVSLPDVLIRATAVTAIAALTGGLSWLPPPRAAAREPGEGAGGTAGAVRHPIRYGETLSEIALRYGVGVRELARANHLRDPDRIVAGRVLVIPRGTRGGKGTEGAAAPPPARPPAAAAPAETTRLAAASRPPESKGTGVAAPGGTGVPPAWPAGLVFEGPGGIRVQVYGVLPAVAPVTEPETQPAAGTDARPDAGPASPEPGGETGRAAPSGTAAGQPGAAPAASPVPGGPAGPPRGQVTGSGPLFSLPLPEGQRAVALTFNGLPGPDAAPGLLRDLEAARARATFFVTGAQVLHARDRVLDLLARGHEVGVQGQDLTDLTELSPRQVVENLSAARQALLAAGAPPPRFFRPPLGRFSAAVVGAARELGMETAMWSSIGLRDQAETDAGRLAERARAAAFPGAVLMLHPDRPVTVAALPAILSALAQEGYRVVSLSELVALATER